MPSSNSHNRPWLLDRPFAHRGLHGARAGRIENSIGAFKAAVEAGYGIELDVQLSADNEAIVFHDADLRRLADENILLAALTMAELATRRLTNGETIPSLRQVLDIIAGRVPVLVEIKARPRATGRLEQAVAGVLDGYRGDAAIMSFNPASLSWFREYRPGVARGLVASTRYRRELGWWLSTVTGQRMALSRTAADFVAYDVRALPNALTRSARAQGLPVLTWTVRTGAQRQRARAHADNVIFEEP